MKHFITLFITLFALLIANSQDFEKERVVSKTFDAGNKTEVIVSNTYGDIKYYAWNEDKIEITATIKVSGKKESNVLKRFESIEVEFEEKQSKAIARTIFEGNSSSNISMSIDYVIKMPKNLLIFTSASYCDVYVTDAFTKAILNLTYSNLTCEKSIDDITVNSTYSDVIMQGNVNNMTLNATYGDSKISGKVTQLKAALTYSDLVVDEVASELTLSNTYSDVKVNRLQKNFKTVKCSSTYSDVFIKVEKGAKYQIKGNGTYSEFSMPNSLDYSQKTQKSSTTTFSATSEEPTTSQITVSNTYSEFNLTEI